MVRVYALKQLVGENEIDYPSKCSKLDWKYCLFKHSIRMRHNINKIIFGLKGKT